METVIPGYPMAALFFLVASVYSIAGLGGASSYLALLVLAGASYGSIAPVALVCNIIVTAGSLLQFSLARLVPVRVIVPFLSASIPLAFLGGLLPVREPVAKVLLAVCLLVAGIYLINYHRIRRAGEVLVPSIARVWSLGPPLGGLMGLVSGMVGIGGGIFLAPVLYVLRWTGARQVAAASSLFILVNSLAGLCGHAVRAPQMAALSAALPLFLAVFLGSQIGSLVSARRLRPGAIRAVTAILVLVAAARILIDTMS